MSLVDPAAEPHRGEEHDDQEQERERTEDERLHAACYAPRAADRQNGRVGDESGVFYWGPIIVLVAVAVGVAAIIGVVAGVT